jgi:hypothetical protein
VLKGKDFSPEHQLKSMEQIYFEEQAFLKTGSPLLHERVKKRPLRG